MGAIFMVSGAPNSAIMPSPSTFMCLVAVQLHHDVQVVQEGLGLFRVEVADQFGEPSDRQEHGQLLALLLPQLSQAQHCPQLQRLRLLPLRNRDGLQKTRFCLSVGVG